MISWPRTTMKHGIRCHADFTIQKHFQHYWPFGGESIGNLIIAFTYISIRRIKHVTKLISLVQFCSNNFDNEILRISLYATYFYMISYYASLFQIFICYTIPGKKVWFIPHSAFRMQGLRPQLENLWRQGTALCAPSMQFTFQASDRPAKCMALLL